MKIKLSILALSILSINQASAYELTDNFALGMYGSAGYGQLEQGDNDFTAIESSTNAYLEVTVKEHFKLMADYNFQTLDLDEEDSESMSGGDIYQGYAQFENKALDIKVGRFADFNAKGYNNLNLSDKMIKSNVTERNVFASSVISTIDGVSFGYSNPIYGGVFESTIYGGVNTQKDSNLDDSLETESGLFGLNFDLKTENHGFLVGFKYSDYSDGFSSEIYSTEEDFNKFTAFFTYNYINEYFFFDGSYQYDYFDLGGEIAIEDEEGNEERIPADDQYIIDVKLGTNIAGFKPYIGFNQYRFKEEDELNTTSVGVKYDYKGFGFLAEARKEEMKDQEDNEVIFGQIFYNF